MEVKPYIDATHAAALLGVDRRTVVADVQAGMRGTLAALCGAETGGICVVSRWELEGDRLAMHRARLGQLQGGASAVCNAGGDNAGPAVTSTAVEASVAPEK